MPSYPNSVYSPRTKENKAGVSYDENLSDVAFAEDITYLDDEVVAISEDLIDNIKPDLAQAISDIGDLETGKQDAISEYIVRRLVSTYANLSKTNSTTSDQDFSAIYTIPANKLTTNKILKCTLLFKVSAGTSSATLAVYVKLGSTKIIITPANNHSDGSNYLFSFIFYILGTDTPSSSEEVFAFLESGRPSVQVSTITGSVSLATNATLDIVPGVTYSATGSTETVYLIGALVEEV